MFSDTITSHGNPNLNNKLHNWIMGVRKSSMIIELSNLIADFKKSRILEIHFNNDDQDLGWIYETGQMNNGDTWST